MSDLMYLGAAHFDGDPGELLGPTAGCWSGSGWRLWTCTSA